MSRAASTRSYCFEFGIVIAKLKLIQTGSEKLQSEIHKLITSICNKEDLPD
jgi:hypothetical protein